MAHKQQSHHGGVISYPPPTHTTLRNAYMLGGYYNYYHHLADYMVNLFSIPGSINHNTSLLTLRPDYGYQKEINKIFGIEHQIVEMEHFSSVKVENLLVPEKAIRGNGVVQNKSTLARCTEYLKRQIGFSGGRGRRLFISRARSSHRRAVNEEQAIDVARDHGFEAVNLEDVTFPEQVRLFATAEAVVGLHGAGFTNVIFAPTGCVVVEIMPTSHWQPDFFRNLATGLGHRFERLYALGSFESPQIEIEIAQFRDALRRNFA